MGANECAKIAMEIDMHNDIVNLTQQQINIQKQQIRFNRIIAVTASIIAIATIFNFMSDILGIDFNPVPDWVLIILFVVAVLFITHLFQFAWKEIKK